ncbi:MAG TPA: hypothetical protein VF587_10605 [Solirubrobacteraceae bacterium]|jgi:hypothetical protein
MRTDPHSLSVEDLFDPRRVHLVEPRRTHDLVLVSVPAPDGLVVKGFPAERPMPTDARILAVVATDGERPTVVMFGGTKGHQHPDVLNWRGPLYDLVATVASHLNGDTPGQMQRNYLRMIGGPAADLV